MMCKVTSETKLLIEGYNLPVFDVKLEDITKLGGNQYKLLWYSNYWDGMLDGMLLHQNNKYWFTLFSENSDCPQAHHYRRYLVIELIESQLKEEEYWHELFREKVGTHTDFDENGHRSIGALKPREIWSEFYEPYKGRKQLDFSKNIVIGWFETK